MSDADVVPRTALEWVDLPTVADGHIVYAYRNSGDAAAVFVNEMISIFPAQGETNVQSYQLQALDSGQEQRTRAPAGGNLPDGAVTIRVQLQASSTTDALDATLENEFQAVVISGELYAEGTTAPIPADLGLTVSYLSVQSDELIVGYSITGSVTVASMSGYASLDHDGDSRWMGVAALDGKDRDDMTRIGVPFDLVDGEGWSLRVAFAATNEDATANASTTIIQPLRAIDGGAEADGDWFVLDQ